jgi:hypothetical protein
MDLSELDLIENKVANSGLITIDLETFRHPEKRVLFDIKGWLFREMILKEKDFRDFVKNHDWSQYQNQNIAFYCSSDAIIPTWAYMLVAAKLSGVAKKIVFGTLATLETVLWENVLNEFSTEEFRDQKIVIKGCGDLPIGADAYLKLTTKLVEVASSVMFGEPCSTVPVYKSKKD